MITVQGTKGGANGGPFADPIQLSGIGKDATATAVFDPASFNFGQIAVGLGSTSKSFRLTNFGDTQLTLGGATISGGDTADFKLLFDGCNGKILAPNGGFCDVVAQFTPIDVGFRASSLAISLGANNGAAVAGLNGEGLPGGPVAAFSPLSHDFQEVRVTKNSLPQKFTLTNTGQTSLTVSGPVALNGGNVADFTVLADGCGNRALNPTETCDVYVQFNPAATSLGQRNSTIAANLGAGNGFAVAAVTGKGIANSGSATFNPANYTFNATPIGFNSVSQTFRLTNNGPEAFSTGGPSLLSGVDAADFDIIADGCNNATLNQGSFCDVIVRFNPQAGPLGARSAGLYVNTGGGFAVANLNGTATAAPTQNATFTPDTVNFGDVPINSVQVAAFAVPIGQSSGPATLTLTNNSGIAVGPLAAAFLTPNPGNADQYTIVSDGCNGKTLTPTAPGNTCDVIVAFTPTSVGVKPASVAVALPGGGFAIASLVGNGVTASANFNPNSHDFGSAALGYNSLPFTFTLTNTTPGPLPVNSVGIVGGNSGEFIITGNGCENATLNAAGTTGSTCLVTVRFSPTSAPLGAKTATLRAELPDGGFATAALTGTATQPTAQATLTPSPANFGSTPIGFIGDIITFTLTNTGNTPITLASPAGILTGPNATDYTILGDGCQGVTLNTAAPGNTCQIIVRFNPQGGNLGLRSSTLAVGLGAGNGFALAELRGTATATPQATASFAPDVVNFGQIAVGQTGGPVVLTLTNTGTTQIVGLPAASLTGPNADQFVIGGNSCTGKTLNPNDTCTLAVSFKPTAVGTLSSSVAIALPGGGFATATLIGQGVTGTAFFNPSSHDFGTVANGYNSLPFSFTLTNTTAGPLAVGGIGVVGGNSGEFLITGNACEGITLNAAGQPGSTCVVTVRFAPTSGPIGNKTATLRAALPNGGFATATLSGTVSLATAQATLLPTPHTFADTAIGFNSVSQTFTLTNTGTTQIGPLSAPAGILTGPNVADFTIISDGCSDAALNPSGTCQLIVRFNPQAGPLGPRSASLAIFLGAESGYAIAELRGNATQAPTATATFTPNPFNFGNVAVGQTTIPQSFTLKNTGSEPIAALPAAFLTGPNADQFIIGGNECTGQTLNPGGSCIVQVSFRPTAIGVLSSSLAIQLPGGGFAIASIYGAGVTASYSVSPAQLTFPTTARGTASAPQTVTITNNSQGVLSLGQIVSNNTNFLVVNDLCSNAALASGQSCTVKVIFYPTGPLGSNVGTLSIPTSGAPATTTVNLTGFAGAPPQGVVAVSPAAFNFGNAQLLSPTAPQTFTLTNFGAQPVTVTAVSILGTDPNDFNQLLANNCTGSILNGGQSCSVQVRFRPNGAGERQARIEFTTDAPGSPHVAYLFGVGISPVVTVSPSQIVFGNVAVGTQSEVRNVTLTNSTQGPISLGAVQIGGGVNSPFKLVNSANCENKTLPGGASCVVGVIFAPTASTSGNQSDTFNIAAGASTYTVSLTGIGVSSAVTLSPQVLNFGDQQVNVQSEPKTITYFNTTNSAVVITGVTTSDSQFILSRDFCSGKTLGAGQNCTVDVSFKPGSQGPKSATASFAGTAPGSPITVPLLGNGTQPVPVLEAAAVDFGNQVINTTSVAQTVTVTNRGPGTLLINNVSITGPNANNFVIFVNNGCAGQLAPQATCTVQVKFTPSALGARQAFLTFDTNAAGSPNNVLLTGNGTPVPSFTTTVNVVGNGCTTSVSPAGPYQGDALVTLTANFNPATTVFIGWTLDGTYVGFANPLDFHVNNSSHNVLATCTPRPSFTDVNAGTPYNEAIIQLAARGVIKGLGDGSFGPNQGIVRAQMAAITVRLAGWSNLSRQNIFTDRCIPAGCVDDELWNAVAVTAAFQVARGYEDNTYRPFDPVANVQAVAFITRTMVKLGYWQFQPDDVTIYPNVQQGTGHRIDIATYVHYAGAVPGTSNPTNAWPEWDQNSTRAYFAGIYWQAYASYFGTDLVP